MIYRIYGSASQAEIHFNSKSEADRLVLKKNECPVGFYEDLYAKDRAGQGLKVLRRWQAERILQKIQSTLPPSKQKFLDVGCGSGIFPLYLREKGLQAFGIDPALPKESQYLKKSDLPGLCSSLGGPFPNRFSCITLLDVIEHFDDPKEPLNHIKTLLKPNGLLVLKVPSKSSLLYQTIRTIARLGLVPNLTNKALGRLFQLDFPPPHYYFYNLPSLKKLLEDNGWKVVDSYYISEAPLSCLWQRLWGMNILLKILLFAGLSLYELCTPSSRKDGLTVHATLMP